MLEKHTGLIRTFAVLKTIASRGDRKLPREKHYSQIYNTGRSPGQKNRSIAREASVGLEAEHPVTTCLKYHKY